MSNATTHPLWRDLASKGFVHVRAFLSESELAKLRNDYHAQFQKAEKNGNYEVPIASPLVTWHFEPKLRAACDSVRAETNIDADMTVCGLYFATEKGISFAWHQDHESFFIYQQHTDYLNFYIPLIKPDVKRSNICLVPFDILKQRVPDTLYRRIVGSGASRFLPEGERTLVYDDERGDEFLLPVNLEDLKVTPQMQPGDLLLLRGDMIHRTQDTDTNRVAVSFRRTQSSGVIKQERFLVGAARKREMIRKNAALYDPLLDCFAALKQDEMTAKQLASYYLTKSFRTATT